jgi:hypothetical protein
MNWRSFFFGIGREKVKTYLSFSHNILEDPYHFSKETAKAFDKLNDIEIRNLKKLFALYEKCMELHAEYFFQSPQAIKRLKDDTTYLYRTYFEMMMLYLVATEQVFHQKKVKDQMFDLTREFVHLIFYGLEFQLFKNIDFTNYKSAIEFKRAFYKDYLHRLFYSENDVYKFPDLHYVVMENPMSEKVDEASLMMVHLNQNYIEAMARSQVFSKYFGKSFNYFSRELSGIRF